MSLQKTMQGLNISVWLVWTEFFRIIRMVETDQTLFKEAMPGLGACVRDANLQMERK